MEGARSQHPAKSTTPERVQALGQRTTKVWRSGGVFRGSQVGIQERPSMSMPHEFARQRKAAAWFAAGLPVLALLALCIGGPGAAFAVATAFTVGCRFLQSDPPRAAHLRAPSDDYRGVMIPHVTPSRDRSSFRLCSGAAAVAMLLLVACSDDPASVSNDSTASNTIDASQPGEESTDTQAPIETAVTVAQVINGFDSPTGDFNDPEAAAARIVGADATRTFQFEGLSITSNDEYRGTTVVNDGDVKHVYPGIALSNGLLVALEDNSGNRTSVKTLVVRHLSDLYAAPTMFDPGVVSTSLSSETTLRFLGDTAFVMAYFTDDYNGDAEATVPGLRESLAAWKVFGLDLSMLTGGAGYISVSDSSVLKCCTDGDSGVLFTAPVPVTGANQSAQSANATVNSTLGESAAEPTATQVDSLDTDDLIALATAAFERLVDRSEATELDPCPSISSEELAASAPSTVELSAVELMQSRVNVASSYPPYDEVSCRFNTSAGIVGWSVLRSIEDAQTQVFCGGQHAGHMTGYADSITTFTFYREGGFQCGRETNESVGIMREVGDGLVFVLAPSFGALDGASAKILIDWMSSLVPSALRQLAGL